MAGDQVAQPSAGPIKFHMTFSHKVAYFSAQLLDMEDSNAVTTLTLTGEDVTLGPMLRTSQFSCSGTQFGCLNGEFFSISGGEDTFASTGETFLNAEITHSSGDSTVYLDNVRICLVTNETSYGVNASVASQPATHDYGSIAINSNEVSQTFVISNSANEMENAGHLVISNIALSGTHRLRRFSGQQPESPALELAVGRGGTFF